VPGKPGKMARERFPGRGLAMDETQLDGPAVAFRAELVEQPDSVVQQSMLQNRHPRAQPDCRGVGRTSSSPGARWSYHRFQSTSVPFAISFSYSIRAGVVTKVFHHLARARTAVRRA